MPSSIDSSRGRLARDSESSNVASLQSSVFGMMAASGEEDLSSTSSCVRLEGRWAADCTGRAAGGGSDEQEDDGRFFFVGGPESVGIREC